LSTSNAAQPHLDQFAATAHPCLTQKGKQQRMQLAWLGDVQKFAHLQRRRLVNIPNDAAIRCGRVVRSNEDGHRAASYRPHSKRLSTEVG